MNMKNVEKPGKIIFRFLCMTLALSLAACAGARKSAPINKSVGAESMAFAESVSRDIGRPKLEKYLPKVSTYTADQAENLYNAQRIDLRQYVQALADNIINDLVGDKSKNHFHFDDKFPLLMTSFVDHEALAETSAMGRLLSEQVATRFTKRGLLIIEPKLMNGIRIRHESGEFILSRQLKEISRQHAAQAVVVGTYTVVDENVEKPLLFLNMKVIRIADNMTIASTSSKLRIDATIRQLLQGRKLAKQVVLENLHFNSGKSDILSSSYATLANHATVLKKDPALEVEIQGHTDSTGATEKNRALSQARADAVKEYFVAQGVAADRLTTKGYGASIPMDSNGTAAGRAKNRRVELHPKY